MRVPIQSNDFTVSKMSALEKDSKNEVILSLKNLGKDHSEKSANGEIEKMDNSSLFKSVSSTHKFVFDERGHIPKTELGFGNCKPISEYTFDYLKSKYGPCHGKSLRLLKFNDDVYDGD